MVAASPVSHEPQSSMAPVKVHQFQLLPWPAFIQGGGGEALTAGTCPVVADYAALPPDGDVIQAPPFQRLLSSFGHVSDDDDEDDTVVNVDEPSGRSLAAALQHHAVAAVGYLHQAVHASATGVDALLASSGTPTQHGIIC